MKPGVTRNIAIIAAVIVVALVIARALLPLAVERYVNGRIARSRAR